VLCVVHASCGCNPSVHEPKMASIQIKGSNFEYHTYLTAVQPISGNFMLSIRPEISAYSENISQPSSVNWSEDITGEKAIRLSGVIEKLNYNLRKALNVDSMKSSFSSLSCPVFVNGHHVTDLHFLIHTLGRDVPVQPTNGTRLSERSSPVTLQVQREIFVYPTVQVHNFLQTDIHVVLTDCQQGNFLSMNIQLWQSGCSY